MQIKSRLVYGLALLLSLASGVTLSSALQDDTSILNTLFEEAGLSADYESSPESLAALAENQETPLQNLYLYLYRNLKLDAQNTALETLSDQTGYSTEELELILIERQPDLVPGTSLELGTEQYATLEAAFVYERSMERELNTITTQSLASELFINGDVGDSGGIDLLYQLNLLHLLIFGDDLEVPDRRGSDPVSYPLPSPDEQVELSSEDFTVTLAEEDPGLACFGDLALERAIQDYQRSVATSGSNASSSGSGSSSGGRSSSGGSSGSSTSSGQGGDAVTSFDQVIGEITSVPGDWRINLPCNDIFCVTVERVNETLGLGSYQVGDIAPTENCIECHLTYIQARLEETLSKPLTPSKVPNNYFEDATCKEAGYGINLDLNIYAIPRPIALDAGVNTNPFESAPAEELRQELLHIGAITLPGSDGPERSQEAAALQKNDESCQAIVNLYELSGLDGNITEALADCIAAQEQQLADTQAAFDAFRFRVRGDSQSELYMAMLQQLSSLLYHVEAIQAAVDSTYATSDSALPSLLNKDYCSS